MSKNSGFNVFKMGLDYIFGHVIAGSVPPIPGFAGVIRGMPGTGGTPQLNLRKYGRR